MIGTQLHPEDRRHVLDAYLYRMTFESVRRWPQPARQMYAGGYRLPLISDAAWLACTSFRTTKRGRLDRRVNHCEHVSNYRVGPILPPKAA
jgi:hypothetical protein